MPTYAGQFREYETELVKLRRHFHSRPELALKETETSAYIRSYLEALGYVLTPVVPTGLMAELPALWNKKKLVAVRAEMDGLPITEQTGLPYASRNPGCMHACGHDAILASALLLAKMIAQEGERFPVGVRFLFEPAEEIGEGASRMAEAGAVDGADAFLMFHYAGDDTFGMAVHEGQASAMIAGIQIHVYGKSSHWCEAGKGIDSIYGASLAVQAVHDLNENYRGKGKCLVGIGAVHGGEYSNIIADHVVLSGNIRACREEDYQELKKRLENALREIEKQTKTKIEMVYLKPPVLSFANDGALTKIAADVGKRIFRERFFLEGEDQLFLSGDNAYRYFQRTKGLFVVFLAGMKEENYPLHHPKFQIDEEILPYSVEALYEILKGMA